MRVLIIDNYDSFTYNLFQAIGTLTGNAPVVHRNDVVSLEAIQAFAPDRIIISPGPGRPDIARDFGVCADVILELGPRIPILGVCLGHQGIVHHLGGRIDRAPVIMHGKTSQIRHDAEGIFKDLPDPLPVMRYHSLIGDAGSLPSQLKVTARTDDGILMGVRHTSWPLCGVQFHPESIGTPNGNQLLQNFLHPV